MTTACDSRRRFLRFLAASPLAARAWAQQTSPQLSSAAEALSVGDFEAMTRNVLPPAHLGYLLTGVDDDLTLAANREGFRHFNLRARRLVDASKPDLKTELFGSTWEMPLFVCPVGGQKAFHPEGEAAVARAAKTKKVVQILSTVTSTPVEDVARNLGAPPWYQLYMPQSWEGTEKMVRRVEAAGCPVLVWTVDLLSGRNTETAERFRRRDTRNCASCHTAPFGSVSQRPMFQGIEGGMNPPAADWSYVDRLRKMTRMKLILKRIDTRDDAILCREHGVDAVLVSNHGGRATETLRSTIEALPEVVSEAGSRVPVFVDGGFRRGTDVFKALALGAKAVGVGRPFLWGLGAFGQVGVDRVIEILQGELKLVMGNCGTRTVADINRSYIAAPDLKI